MTLLGNTRLVVACVVLSIVLISHHAAADEYCEETSHDSASAWRQCALGEGEGGRSVSNTSLLNLSQNKLLKRKGQTLTPRQSALGESAVANDQFSSSTYAKVLLQEQTKCPDVTLKCPTSKAKPQHRKGNSLCPPKPQDEKLSKMNFTEMEQALTVTGSKMALLMTSLDSTPTGGCGNVILNSKCTHTDSGWGRTKIFGGMDADFKQATFDQYDMFCDTCNSVKVPFHRTEKIGKYQLINGRKAICPHFMKTGSFCVHYPYVGRCRPSTPELCHRSQRSYLPKQQMKDHNALFKWTHEQEGLLGPNSNSLMEKVGESFNCVERPSFCTVQVCLKKLPAMLSPSYHDALTLRGVVLPGRAETITTTVYHIKLAVECKQIRKQVVCVKGIKTGRTSCYASKSSAGVKRVGLRQWFSTYKLDTATRFTPNGHTWRYCCGKLCTKYGSRRLSGTQVTKWYSAQSGTEVTKCPPAYEDENKEVKAWLTAFRNAKATRNALQEAVGAQCAQDTSVF